MNRKRIMVFAPHPDDETLGCGGTIAKKSKEGYEVLIVVLTDGRGALSKVLGIDSNPTPSELKEIRKKEVKRATKILGIPEDNLLFLDFEDGTLENKEKEAKKQIAAILRQRPPTEVYFTYSKDFNPDHRAANRMVRNAIVELDPFIMRYQYSITQRYSRVGPILDSFLNLFKHNMIYVDISEFVGLKQKALEEFKSETTIISSRQEKPVLSTQTIRRHLEDKEVFYKDS